MATGIKRTYADFTGVDFLDEPSLIDIRRSPDALNVWKNYRDNQGTCIETRPGYRQIAKVGNSKINGIYIWILSMLFDEKKSFIKNAVNKYLKNIKRCGIKEV